ncbi:MAG: hypothetical protein H0W88_07670 [Parachlamydiaceae bacterium]|nr:hypothetical protein [Parachlamydiaceae bacterium]
MKNLNKEELKMVCGGLLRAYHLIDVPNFLVAGARSGMNLNEIVPDNAPIYFY